MKWIYDKLTSLHIPDMFNYCKCVLVFIVPILLIILNTAILKSDKFLSFFQNIFTQRKTTNRSLSSFVAVFLLGVVLLFCHNGVAQITLRGTFTSATTTNTTLTIPKPTGIVAGDLLLVNIAQGNNNTNAPSLAGWTTIDGRSLGGGGGVLRYGIVLYKVAGVSEPSSYSFTLGTGTNSAVGTMLGYSGVDVTGGFLVGGSTGGPFDVIPGTISVQGNTSSVSATSITTNTANALVIMFGQAVGGTRTWSAWSTATAGALTEIFDNQNSSGDRTTIGAASLVKATAGLVGAGSATLSGNERNGGILIALKAAIPPTITSFTPSAGCANTTSVVITGTNFTGATAVSFGLTNALSFTVNSATQITATPAAGTTGTIAVTTAGGTATSASSFTVNALPTVFTVTGTGSYCSGGTGVAVGLSGSQAGVNYTLSPSGAVVAGTGAAISFGNQTTAATYTVTATNATTNCTLAMSGSAVVTVNPLPTAVSVASSGSYCLSTNITASGGTGGAIYFQGANSGGTSTTTATSSALITTSGTYYFRSMSAAGCWGAEGSANITINPLPVVSAPSAVCVGSTITLSPTTNGAWTSSNNAIATVTNAGIVTGVSAGSAIFTYTLSATGCSKSTAAVTVNALPVVAPILGVGSSICINGSAIYTNATVGGTWSIINGTGYASIDESGELADLAEGDVTVVYTYSNGTCTNSVSKALLIRPLPTIGAIAGGASSICVNAETPAFTNSIAGGEWSITNGTGAASITVNGFVTGITAGSVNVLYTINDGYCSSSVGGALIVNPLPPVSAIMGGATTVCVNSTTPAFTNATPGGTWSITNGTTYASISAAGVVTGLAAGSATVAYTINNGTCVNVAQKSIIVYALPVLDTIAGGASSVCINSSSPAFTNTVSGGTWSVQNVTGLASIASNGVITGLSAGLVLVKYTYSNGICSNEVTKSITVNELPIAGAITGATVVCTGSTISLSSNATGTGLLVYTWASSNNLIATVTNAGLAGAIMPGTASMFYTVTDPNGCSATSAAFPIVINARPLANITNIDTSICNGGSMVIRGNVTASGNWTITLNNGAIATGNGNRNFSITLSPLTTSSYTILSLIDSVCSAIPADLTGGFIVTVNEPVAIVTQPVSNTICATLPASLSVAASGTGLTYQWYKGIAPGIALTNGPNITGATSSILNFNQVGLADTDNYYVAINGLSPCTNVQSGYALLTVLSTITIVQQPLSQAVCTGSNAVFMVNATAGGNPLSYQWRKNTGAGFVNIIGATLPTLTITNTTIADAGLYDVVITGTIGCIVAYSMPQTLTVHPLSVGGTVNSSLAVCSGANSGVVTLSGQTGNVIKWEYSTDAGASWLPIANTTTSLTYTNLTVETQYRAVVQSGSCIAENSLAATISIKPLPVAIATPSTQTICSGASIDSILLTASLPLTNFLWTRNNTVSVTGIAANGSSNIGGALTNITSQPQTVLFNNTPQTNGCTGVSIIATVIVNPIPVLLPSPASQTICSGNAITTIALSSATIGTAFTWTRDNVLAVTGISGSGSGASISGTLTNTTANPILVTFTITPNANGCVGIPVIATVLVNPTPNAVLSIASQDVCSGSSVTAISISGAVSTTTFNWVRNNTTAITGIAASGSGNITGTLTNNTSAPVTVTFTITPVANGCAGVAVTATVIVYPTSIGGTLSSGATVCSNANSGTITLSGSTGNIIRWESSINNGVSWSSIANTTISQTYTNLTQTTIYRAVIQSGICTSVNSSTATITVNTVPVGGSVSADNTVCSGSNSGTLTLSGYTGNIIRWESSTNGGVAWNTIANTATTQNYFNLTQTTIYRAVLQNGVCANVNSATATITVNPLPSIVPAVSANNVCFSTSSQSSTLSYSNALNGANQYSITWNASPSNSFAAVTNAVLPVSPVSITVPSNTPAGTYTGTITVRNSTTGCVGTGTNFTITVNATSVGGTASSSATVCSGINNNTIALTGNTGSIVRWEFSTNSGTSWTSIANTTSSQTYTNLTVQTIYRAVVQSGVCPSANSSQATISINPLPTITTAAASSSLCFDASNSQTATLAYSATTNSPTTYSISWNASPANSLAAVTNATLVASPINITVPANTPAGSYTGTITVRNANSCTSSPGNTFTLTVNPLPTVAMAADYCTVPGKVVLTATPAPAGTYTYLWSDGGITSSIQVDIAGSYTVLVTNTNGCKVTGAIPVNTELATNGNFESGNTGFTTGYGYVNNTTVNGLVSEGKYTVNNNPNVNHSNFWGIDHTTGTGNMMIVNGVVGPTVWQQNITVEPNTVYYFAAWALSVNNAGNYAKLQFSINGTVIGSPVQLVAGVRNNATNNNWQRFYGTWNSGAATSAACSIVDLVSAAGGNDFALDDISISTLTPYVKLISAPSTPIQTVCKNSSITNIVYAVGGNGADPIVAGLPPGLTTTFNGINLTISGAPTSAGVYNYTVTSPGCTPVTLGGQITVQEQTITQTSAAGTAAQTICLGSAISSIIYTVGGTAIGASVTGMPAGVSGVYLAGVYTITGIPTVAGTYNYTVTTTGTCTAVTAIGTLTVNQPTIAPVSFTATTASICNGSATTISQVGGSLGTNATWKWYTNASYTNFVGNGSGASATLSVSPTTTTTYYLRAEGAASPCTGTVAGPVLGVTITVNQLSANPTSAVSSLNNICPGTGTVLTLTGGGGGAAQTIAWFSGSCGGTLVGTGNSLTVFPSATTTYFGRYQNGSPCNYNTSCVSVTVTVQAGGTWLGINTNWFDVLNWCGGTVPTSSTDVLINAGLLNYPIITASIGRVNNITIQANASVTVLATTLQVAGTITNNGTFNAVTGLIELNGTSAAQSISGSMFVNNKINALVISNPMGVNVSGSPNNMLTIVDYISFGNVNNAILNTGNNITLQSSIVKTARLADITNNGINSGNNVTGKVVVERFIPPRRSWRMLSVPLQAVSDVPTINAAWQEAVVNTDFVFANNQNPAPGYGLHISGSSPALGFDATPLNNPSIRIYNQATDTWSGLPNTLSTKLTDYPGLMVFVRGNRSTQLSQNTSALTTSTVLRATGNLKIGLQSISLPASTGSFDIVANPYASSIDFRRLSLSSNVSDGFSVWDPSLTGSYNVGAFQYFVKLGSDYVVFPGGGSYGAALSITNTIQSGQAVMIQHSGAGSLQINENAKVTTSSSLTFRPAPVALPGYVGTFVHYLEPDNSTVLIDGTLALIDDKYSNTVDKDDFKKVGNISENLSIVNKDFILAIEKRNAITKDDTIQLKFSKVRVRKYRFVIDFNYLPTTGLEPLLEDVYLKTKTPLSLAGSTNYDFNIINHPDSYNPLRFRIVFRPLTTLPVSFTAITATRQNDGIKVVWKVASEINIAQYEVEKSTDGIHFTKIDQVKAMAQSGYQLMDKNIVAGNVFYRIIAIGLSGEKTYSNIVKLTYVNPVSGITIYPNPVVNGSIGLQMKATPAGTYMAKIINQNGQVIYTQKIVHAGGNINQKITSNKYLVPGNYQLEITKPDLSTETIKFFSQ